MHDKLNYFKNFEQTIFFDEDTNQVLFIDQRYLPLKEELVICKSFEEIQEAIFEMKLRGAPLIGVAGAFGLLLWCINNKANYKDVNSFINELINKCDLMSKTRPTAVNLKWACEKVKFLALKFQNNKSIQIDDLVLNVKQLCLKLNNDDILTCKKIGAIGAEHISKTYNKKLKILTHCNAGALATCGYGTALGVIRSLHKLNLIEYVLVDETRPYLQGARITAYELNAENIPYYVICDNMAGWLMKNNEVDIIITGADRITLNGDFANKIGTYSIAILAYKHKIPFYIAAPISTFDFNIKNGKMIPIEERNAKEVTHILNLQITPYNTKVKNPAFDVTESKYLTGIITEFGVITKPYYKNIKKLLKNIQIKNNE